MEKSLRNGEIIKFTGDQNTKVEIMYKKQSRVESMFIIKLNRRSVVLTSIFPIVEEGLNLLKRECNLKQIK